MWLSENLCFPNPVENFIKSNAPFIAREIHDFCLTYHNFPEQMVKRKVVQLLKFTEQASETIWDWFAFQRGDNHGQFTLIYFTPTFLVQIDTFSSINIQPRSGNRQSTPNLYHSDYGQPWTIEGMHRSSTGLRRSDDRIFVIVHFEWHMIVLCSDEFILKFERPALQTSCLQSLPLSSVANSCLFILGSWCKAGAQSWKARKLWRIAFRLPCFKLPRFKFAFLTAPALLNSGEYLLKLNWKMTARCY